MKYNSQNCRLETSSVFKRLCLRVDDRYTGSSQSHTRFKIDDRRNATGGVAFMSEMICGVSAGVNVSHLMLVLAVHLSQLAVHQVLHSVNLRLHLLFRGLELVLQFADQRFAAAAVQRSLRRGKIHEDVSEIACSE